MSDPRSGTITGGRPGSGAHRVVALCGPYLSGKTSLFESLLYATGAIGRRGSTRAGTSVGDGAPEARKRSMGTELNIASVDYLGDQWTFLDAPGSIEFLHDTFAALAVCDAAVVVCEPSPERVAALTPLLKYIEDHHIPHILFINKIDSAEARVRDMLAALQTVSSRKLVLRQVPIRKPTADGGEEAVGYVDLVSERAYRYKSSGASDLIEMPAEILPRESEARREMLETLSEFDDTLLEQLIEDVAPEKSLIYRDLHDEFGADQIAPVLLGAGDRENGVRRLLKALRHDDYNCALCAKGYEASIDDQVEAGDGNDNVYGLAGDDLKKLSQRRRIHHRKTCLAAWRRGCGPWRSTTLAGRVAGQSGHCQPHARASHCAGV